ncbi:Dihydrolipoamide acetyltransferase component of pyruvate dehydrogenase complex [Cronobacter malonaticus 681]|nr:Dihydrolipoamide acetyltransferase component of pyruvate dehydrogenase complex [Cronobacter malonaticus 681]
MAIEINVPDIGADEVEVTEILVKVGDKVEAEQSLITVEGDKASMEVPSPQAGVVKEIKVSVGDKVETGKLIMIFSPGKVQQPEKRRRLKRRKKPLRQQHLQPRQQKTLMYRTSAATKSKSPRSW